MIFCASLIPPPSRFLNSTLKLLRPLWGRSLLTEPKTLPGVEVTVGTQGPTAPASKSPLAMTGVGVADGSHEAVVAVQ